MANVIDEKSLESLVRAYLKPIYNFVYRYIGGADDAEEITQEVFVKVWRHLGKFDQSKSFKIWLFSIAKNTALDFLKKKKAVPFSELAVQEGENALAESLAAPAPLPQEILEKQDLAQRLNRALETLASKYRPVLFLRYNDHFTFREIAETLGEPLQTVKSRHRRALILLRKLLEDS